MNKISDKQSIILHALIKKIKEESSTSFFIKNVFNQPLFTWNNVSDLLNDFYRVCPEDIELIDLDQNKSEYPLVLFDWMRNARPDPGYIIQKLNEYYTLIILGISRFNFELNYICKCLEDIIQQVAVDVHVYCGLEKSKSFKAHFDLADNFIIHQSGSCHWKVYKQRAEDKNYERNVDSQSLDIEFETKIEAGDIIYIPRYKYHECIPLEKRISLSLPIVESKNPIDRNWYNIG